MKYLIVEKIKKRCSSLFRAARRQANHNPRNPPPRASAIDRMRCCCLLSSHWLEGAGGTKVTKRVFFFLGSCTQTLRVDRQRGDKRGPRRPKKGPPPPGAKKVNLSSFLQKSFLTFFFTDFFQNFDDKRSPKTGPKGPLPAQSKKSAQFIVFAKGISNRFFHRFFSRIWSWSCHKVI